MGAITEIINSFVTSPAPDRIDEVIFHGLANADGDWGRLARDLAYACLALAQREMVAVKIAEQLMPSIPKKRGRPPRPVAAGLYVPVEFRTKRETAGAPRQNALPKSTKVHAIQAVEAMRLDPENLSTARHAAIIELVVNDIRPTERLISNLQKRISEVLRGS
jgi:hypothetical protein